MANIKSIYGNPVVDDNLRQSVATEYSSSSTYAVGDFSLKDGQLYECNTAISTAEAWTAAHWTAVTVGGELATVKDGLTGIENLDDNVALSWVIGGLANNGTENSNTSRIRTGFVDVSNSKSLKITIADGYQANVLRFRSDKSQIGYSGWIPSGNTMSITVTDIAYVRIVVKRNDDADMSTSEGSNVALIRRTELLDAFDGIENDINKFNANLVGVTGVELLSYVKNTYIPLNGTTTDITNLRPLNNYECVVAPCASGDVFVVTAEGQNATRPWGFVASDGTILAVASANTSVNNLQLVAPSNSAYFVSNNRYETKKSLAYKKTSGVISFGSPQNNWYILGDSISAGYYSMTASMAQEAGITLDYNSPVTTEDGEATGAKWDRTLAHNYWGYINDWYLKRTLIGKAYPGQGFLRTATNNQNGIDVVKNNDFSDAGLITVAWGFNDWHYNQPRGDHSLIDASVPYPTENYDTSQLTTLNHAIWYCLGELIRKAPKAKIVVQTPMNGWAYGGDFASNWGIGYTLSQSGKLSDIHDDIKYWADYYGLQVLDLTYNNSIVNRRNIKDTIIDGSHPSDEAHQQLARSIWTFVGY